MIVELEIVCITAKPYIPQKILFYWFCSSSFNCHMKTIILTSEVMEAVTGQKISSEGQNSMNEWIFWKKVLIKVVQWPQKPLLWTISRRSFTIFLQKWVKLNVGRWKRHTTEGKTIEALKSSHSFSLQPRQGCRPWGCRVCHGTPRFW